MLNKTSILFKYLFDFITLCLIFLCTVEKVIWPNQTQMARATKKIDFRVRVKKILEPFDLMHAHLKFAQSKHHGLPIFRSIAKQA